MAKLKSVSLWLAILGASKIILDMNGIQISNEQINIIANGIASIMTVLGIFLDHGKETGEKSE